ncbi:unnamed protein product, partial [Coregonus sp. 'balchen']
MSEDLVAKEDGFEDEESSTMKTMNIGGGVDAQLSLYLQRWKRPSRAMCLGLLRYYSAGRNQQARFNTLTKERDQLQEKVNKLDMELNGKRTFGESIYYLSTEKTSWHERRQDCQKRGLDLVIINSEAKQEFIYGFKKCLKVWIDLHDIKIEEDWEWVDGISATTTYWMKNVPNNYDVEDCGMFGDMELNLDIH